MNNASIVINGVSYGLKFGMCAARYLSDKLTNKYCFSGETLTEIGIAHVLYGGYVNYCAVNDLPEELKFADVVDYVEGSVSDKSRVQVITDVIGVWTRAQIAKQSEEDEKKTPPLKKSKGLPTK